MQCSWLGGGSGVIWIWESMSFVKFVRVTH
jgi:hypothetical protein